MDEIKLYTSSTEEYTEIDFKNLQGYRDLGQGIYLSEDKELIQYLALEKAARYSKRKGCPIITPILYTYTIDKGKLDGLKTKEYISEQMDDTAWSEWFDLIESNRKTRHNSPAYDILSAPMTWAGSSTLVNSCVTGINKKDEVLRQLREMDLPRLMCFCSKKAIDLLNKSTTEQEEIHAEQ